MPRFNAFYLHCLIKRTAVKYSDRGVSIPGLKRVRVRCVLVNRWTRNFHRQKRCTMEFSYVNVISTRLTRSRRTPFPRPRVQLTVMKHLVAMRERIIRSDRFEIHVTSAMIMVYFYSVQIQYDIVIDDEPVRTATTGLMVIRFKPKWTIIILLNRNGVRRILVSTLHSDL